MHFKKFRLYFSLVVIVIIGIAFVVVFYPREHLLNGLLVDLELKEPDPGRYTPLRTFITETAVEDLRAVKNIRTKIGLSYIHFSNFSKDYVLANEIDFLVLSPQGTPWRRYTGEIARQLDFVKKDLKTLIFEHNLPVLGICGGHQFLALTFGGVVDFIDTKFLGASPECYPKEAIAERGVVALETLHEDPIFYGITSHPGTLWVVESHYEEVKNVPEPLVNLARSSLSEAQLMRIPGKTVYGFAFHPEKSDGLGNENESRPNDGRLLMANFLKMVQKNAH